MSVSLLMLLLVVAAGAAWFPRIGTLVTILVSLAMAGCHAASGATGAALFACIVAAMFGWLGWDEMRRARSGEASG